MLEARQKAAKASAARSNDERANNLWAKTRPTKRARFFVHWRGRMAFTKANSRSFVPGLRGAVSFAIEEIASPGLCVCSSVVKIVFFKRAVFLHNKNLQLSPL